MSKPESPAEMCVDMVKSIILRIDAPNECWLSYMLRSSSSSTVSLGNMLHYNHQAAHWTPSQLFVGQLSSNSFGLLVFYKCFLTQDSLQWEPNICYCQLYISKWSCLMSKLGRWSSYQNWLRCSLHFQGYEMLRWMWNQVLVRCLILYIATYSQGVVNYMIHRRSYSMWDWQCLHQLLMRLSYCKLLCWHWCQEMTGSLRQFVNKGKSTEKNQQQ